MPTQKITRLQAEELVRRVLTENFQQRVDGDTLSAVADKVSKAVAWPAPRTAEEAGVEDHAAA